jgi:tripartite-type tricarboxylate transporter receptor subunit TctC
MSHAISRRALIAATVTLGVFVASPVVADDYPSKNIRIVVPFPAGGGTDVVARVVVPKLAEELKHTVYIDNIGGASGSLGHEAVARAAPDGYTLLLATASTIATNPLISKVPWDPVKDFSPIGMVSVDPMPLVVTPSLPVNNVQELIALAKAKPDSLTMASFGIGSVPHLAGELLKAQAGIKMLHVPYKGGAQALNDLIGGHVSLMFNSVGAIAGPVAAGQVRLIAVGAPERSPGLPNIPTIKESGLSDFAATSWIGLFGPAKLPKPIVDKVSQALAAALKDPGLKEKLAKMGSDTTSSGTPHELADTLAGDLKRWGKLVRDANIHID